MPTKMEKARRLRTQQIGPKADLKADANLAKKQLHEKYKDAEAALREMMKTESPNSKRLIKQMEIVANLSPYKEI